VHVVVTAIHLFQQQPIPEDIDPSAWRDCLASALQATTLSDSITIVQSNEEEANQRISRRSHFHSCSLLLVHRKTFNPPPSFQPPGTPALRSIKSYTRKQRKQKTTASHPCRVRRCPYSHSRSPQIIPASPCVTPELHPPRPRRANRHENCPPARLSPPTKPRTGSHRPPN
jgi:hypothetical protein